MQENCCAVLLYMLMAYVSIACVKVLLPSARQRFIFLWSSEACFGPPATLLWMFTDSKEVKANQPRSGGVEIVGVTFTVTRDTASRSLRGLLLTSLNNIPRTGSLRRVALTGVACAGDQGVPEIQRHAQVHGVQLSARGAARVAAAR